jgi:hypothetical protein
MATTSIEEAATIIGGRTADGEPIPFSIEFVTCDMVRGTGGERIKLTKAGIFTLSKKFLSDKPQAAVKENAEPGTSTNWRNATRNIQCLHTGKPYKIHLLLIERINGITVAL